jgi:ubiquitin C-terminal hydrolase
MPFGDDVDETSPADIKMAIFEPPPVLILHAKRFERVRGVSYKLATPFQFEQSLIVHDVCTADAKKGVTTYDLFAVIVHKGGIEGGHYWCFIRNGVEWVKFNCGTVSEVLWEDVQKCGLGVDSSYGSGYIFFYVKTDSYDRIAGQADYRIPRQLTEAEPPELANWGHNPDRRT